MADGVKWIKISTDMFDNLKIRQIEALPDGDALIVVWVHLLLMAGKVNASGTIYLTPQIPYTDQMLAIEVRKPISTVQMALKIFQQFAMIEINDDFITIKNWAKYQNSEGLERIREQSRARVQKYRQKKSAEITKKETESENLVGDNDECNVTRNATVTLPLRDVTEQNKNKNKSKREDKDLDKDVLEKEKDLKDIKTSCTEQNKSAPVLADVDPVILNDDSEWRPDIDLYHEYQRLYPAVDVGAEFAKMRGWCLGNPKKRKTKSGVKRFVTSWLGRAQDEYHPAQAKSGSAYIDAIRNRVDIVDTWT